MSRGECVDWNFVIDLEGNRVPINIEGCIEAEDDVDDDI